MTGIRSYRAGNDVGSILPISVTILTISFAAAFRSFHAHSLICYIRDANKIAFVLLVPTNSRVRCIGSYQIRSSKSVGI